MSSISKHTSSSPEGGTLLPSLGKSSAESSVIWLEAISGPNSISELDRFEISSMAESFRLFDQLKSDRLSKPNPPVRSQTIKTSATKEESQLSNSINLRPRPGGITRFNIISMSDSFRRLDMRNSSRVLTTRSISVAAQQHPSNTTRPTPAAHPIPTPKRLNPNASLFIPKPPQQVDFQHNQLAPFVTTYHGVPFHHDWDSGNHIAASGAPPLYNSGPVGVFEDGKILYSGLEKIAAYNAYYLGNPLFGLHGRGWELIAAQHSYPYYFNPPVNSTPKLVDFRMQQSNHVTAPTIAVEGPLRPNTSERFKVFTLFASLPGEIRLKISAYNLPPPQTVHLNYNVRDVHPDHYGKNAYGYWQIMNGHQQFSNLQTCQESRFEAFKSGYVLIPLASDATKRFWFNYETDTMFWNTNSPWGIGRFQHWLSAFRIPLIGEVVGHVRGPSYLPIEVEFWGKLQKLAIADRLCFEWDFDYRSMWQDGLEGCEICLSNVQDHLPLCPSCLRHRDEERLWKAQFDNSIFEHLNKLQIVVIPDRVDTYHTGDFYFQRTKYGDLEEEVREAAIERFDMSWSGSQDLDDDDYDQRHLSIDSKVEIVEIAGVKVSSMFSHTGEKYIHHVSLANGYLSLQAEKLASIRPLPSNAEEDASLVESFIKKRTSKAGIAELLENVGIFFDVCPILLLRPDRLKTTCDVPGCTGKTVCNVINKSGTCGNPQCQEDDKVIHIRKTCPMEANFGTWQGCCTYGNPFGEIDGSDHPERVHAGELDGEYEWSCRQASAKLIPAHEMGLWLVDKKKYHA